MELLLEWVWYGDFILIVTRKLLKDEKLKRLFTEYAKKLLIQENNYWKIESLSFRYQISFTNKSTLVTGLI